MANYTIAQCLEARNVSEPIKQYLRTLQTSKLPTVNGKTFQAQNQTQLVTVLETEFAKYQAAKEKRSKKEECLAIVRGLVTGDKDNRRLISADELLPRLQQLKTQIEQEKKFQKIDNLIESTGMTKEQLIEYLQG
jgi:hypothetical protein